MGQAILHAPERWGGLALVCNCIRVSCKKAEVANTEQEQDHSPCTRCWGMVVNDPGCWCVGTVAAAGALLEGGAGKVGCCC